MPAADKFGNGNAQAYTIVAVREAILDLLEGTPGYPNFLGVHSQPIIAYHAIEFMRIAHDVDCNGGAFGMFQSVLDDDFDRTDQLRAISSDMPGYKVPWIWSAILL